MLIGERVKHLRKQRKLTQKTLGEKVGISRSYLADIEGNRYNPSADTIKSLAFALDVDVNYFLTDDESQLHLLSLKDQKDIAKDLDTIMNKLDNEDDDPLYFNGNELDQDDKELFRDAIYLALKTIKVKNKNKYTPKKYKKQTS